MGDLVLTLVSLASLGSALAALALAFRHHCHMLLLHDGRPPTEGDQGK